MRLLPALIVLALVAGCSQPSLEEAAPSEVALFSPTAMRIHPIFTQIKDFNANGVPDGIEALIEFQDQFGDPTKAAGTVMFELYDYRPGNPEPRGPRLVNPWIGSITTVQEQRSRWNRTSRTYTFQLADPGITTKKSYVLTATFRSNSGGRFFDRVILQGQEENGAPSTQPATKSNSGFLAP